MRPLLRPMILASLVAACGDEEGFADRSARTCRSLAAACPTRCAAAPGANAECTGSLTGTFANVVVPAGASCDLGDALLTGNLLVRGGATLLGRAGLFVCGNVQSEPQARISLDSAQVCGNVQVQDNAGVRLSLAEVNENLQIEQSRDVAFFETLVCADAQLTQNRGVAAPGEAMLVVEKNCTASGNTGADLSGVLVRGQSSGCGG